MRRRVALVAAALAGLLLPACGKPSPPAATTTTTTTTTTTSTSTTTAATSTTTTSTTTSTTTASALAQLSGFIDGAKTVDAKLRAAAAAINRTGPPFTSVSAQVADAVQAAEVEPLARAIPAGLPQPLRRQTFVVYSELVSRRSAMNEFAFARGVALPDEQAFMLRSLGFGHEAAVRFPADLAALAVLARATAPFAAAPASSHEAAEVFLMAEFVRKINEGCGNTGGAIITELPKIVWEPGGNPGERYDGRIDDVAFVARFANGAWDVQIWAC